MKVNKVTVLPLGIKHDEGYWAINILGLEFRLSYPCEEWNWGFTLACRGKGFCFDKGYGFWWIRENLEDFWLFPREA